MSSIKMSTFNSNEVQNFGSIFLVESSLELDDITIEKNVTEEQTSGIVLVMSSVIVSNSRISKQYGLNGSFIHCT